MTLHFNFKIKLTFKIGIIKIDTILLLKDDVSQVITNCFLRIYLYITCICTLRFFLIINNFTPVILHFNLFIDKCFH